MRTLIVLCAGNYKMHKLPLYLNHHPDSKLLAYKLLDNIYAEHYKRIIFTISSEDCEKYNAIEVLNASIDHKFHIEIYSLEVATSGPAESVYRTIKAMNITGEIAIRDSTSTFRLTKEVHGNFAVGLDINPYTRGIYRVHTKSFIITNEHEQILDIVEKSFRSDIISVGLYGFADTNDYVMAYERIVNRYHPVDGLYVSNIISYLIGYKQMIFSFVSATDYEDWKDPDEWNRLRELNGQTKLVMVDLDGTLADTRKVNYLSYCDALERHGYYIDYEYYCEYCNGKYYMDFLPKITTQDETVLRQIHAEKMEAYKKYIAFAVPNKTLIDILRLLGREYHKALVTTSSRENTSDILCYLGLSDFFELILTREDTEQIKPAPDGFQKAMTYFSARPENCIIFEDSKEGIEAAERAGVQCYIVKGLR